jgi:hypothetical protein
VSVNYVGTNESARNSYTDKKLREKEHAGKRIDYIMYKPGPGIEVNICLLTGMKDTFNMYPAYVNISFLAVCRCSV